MREREERESERETEKERERCMQDGQKKVKENIFGSFLVDL